MKSRNHQRLLHFADIQSPVFDADAHRISCVDAMAKIHGRLANGELLIGVPVFAEAYRRAGLPALAWLLSVPWARAPIDYVYQLFARHRHIISRMLGSSLLWWAKRRYP